jgi:hypothetical protein
MTVRALRDLDMPLEEIKGVLGGSPEDAAGLRDLLAACLDEPTVQADRLQQLIYDDEMVPALPICKAAK